MNDAEPPAPGASGDRSDQPDSSPRTWPSGGHSIHELGHPDITELELGRTTHKVAEVQPMDLDGVSTMTVGTIIWAIAAIVILVLGDRLGGDTTTWLWTAVTGCALGIVGIFYCRRRRTALNSRRAQSSADESS